MVFINGIDFPIYVTDTIESIKNRIAATWDPPTLAKYLVFNPPLTDLKTFKSQTDVVVRDILSEIRYVEDMELPQIDLPEDNKLDKQEDIEKVFIAYNAYLTRTDPKNVRMLTMAMKGLTINKYDAWLKRDYTIKTLEKAIENNKRTILSALEKIKEFDNIPRVKSTVFSITNIQLTFYFGHTRQILTQFFNSIVLDTHTPFAQYNNLYKIYAGFIPQIEWTEIKTDDVILLKVNNEKNGHLRLLKDPYRKYTTVAFGIEDSIVAASTEINIGRRFATRDYIQNRIERIFEGQNLTVEKVTENSVIGQFFIPDQKLNPAVWAELTMNNSLFKRLVVINEFITASKIKQNVYLHIIDTKEAVSLQMRHTKKLYEIPGIDMKIGAAYIRARITKAANITAALNVQAMITKLFHVYNEKYDAVVADYKQYIPRFGIEVGAKRKPKSKKPVQLKDIAPDLFLSNYSRKCIYKPTIISDEEAVTTDKIVMRYPIKGEGIERNYICEHTDNPYPGLRKNPLANKDIYPLLPCCYSIDQRQKPGSKYRQYYNNEIVPADKPVQVQEIFITAKILHPTIIGILPKPIKNMFAAFNTDPKVQFLRKGVHRSGSSSIEAVMVAKKLMRGPELDIRERLEDQRARLHTKEFAAAAKQEMYDKSIEYILNTIQHHHMSAELFVHLLEEAFDVDIILFSKDRFLIPPHKCIYYKMKPRRPTIFIYEHMGSESDEAAYPQCELIIKAAADDVQDHVAIFEPDDPIVVGVFQKYHEYNSIYKFSKPLPMLTIDKLPFISQRLDGFGKGRIYNLYDDSIGKVITMVTDPIPPFALPYADVIHRVDSNTIIKFCRRFNLSMLRQRIDEDILREIDVSIGTIEGTLLAHGEKIPEIPIDPIKERFNRLTNNQLSIINQFIRDKRLAKLLFNYTKYIMSEYLLSNNIHEITSDVINDFVKKHIIIDPSITYDLANTSPMFTYNNTFIRRGKLVLPSEELLKRLIFILRLFLHTNKFDMLTFHRKTIIEDYYGDIDDYDLVKTQYLFDNPEAVRRLISNKDIKCSITNKVLVDQDRAPYFFQNSKVGSNAVYLAQNTTNYDEANSIVYGWRTKKVNIAIEGPRQNVFIYAYTNEREITMIQEGPSISEIILGYKVRGISRYTVLMKL